MPFDPHWSPPTGFDAKLGPLDGISCGPPGTHGNGPTTARITADWLPFAPGTTFPAPEADMFPATTDAGEPASQADWQQIGDWKQHRVLRDTRLLHATHVGRLEFTPDGRFLLAVSRRCVVVWEVLTGRDVRSYQLPNPLVFAAMSPCGRFAVVPREFGQNILWELATGIFLAVFEARSPTAVVFSADGSRFFVANHTAIIEYDIAGLGGESGGENRAVLPAVNEIPHDPYTAVSLAVSADGARIASGSHNGKLRVWNRHNRELLHTIALGRVAANPTIKCQALTIKFSPDGNRLLAGINDGRIIEWDMHTGREIRRVQGPLAWARSMAISRDGRVMVAGGDDADGAIFDMATGEIIANLPHAGEVTACAISADGRLIATATDSIKIWDAAHGHLLIDGDLPTHGIAISAAGDAVAVTFADDRLEIFGVDDGATRGEITAEFTRENSPEFSSDGKLIAAAVRADDGDAVVLIDASDCRIIARLALPAGSYCYHSLAFAAADRRLLVGCQMPMVFDVASRTPLPLFQRIDVRADGAILTADGDRLIFSQGNEICVWDIGSDREIARMADPAQTGGHEPFSCIAISPDGTCIAASGAMAVGGHAVTLWDVATRTIFARLELPGFTRRLYFSPDSRQLQLVGNGEPLRQISIPASSDEHDKLRHLLVALDGFELAPTTSDHLGDAVLSADRRTMLVATAQHRLLLYRR